MHLASTRDRDQQDGYVLLVFALLLVPMMIIAALAIDYGSWALQANRQQSAADAAALAGAPVLPDFDWATDLAREIAAQNGYDHNDLP